MTTSNSKWGFGLWCLALGLLLAPVAHAQSQRGNGIGTGSNTDAEPMVDGLGQWDAAALFTVGDVINGYQPPGILDGLGAFALDHRTVRVLANHELVSSAGYPYQLANGTELTGARVSYFDLHRTSRKLLRAGLAYDTIVDRAGNVVVDPAQIGGGINRLCSASYFPAGSYGLADGIYFTGEETDGGTEFALDVSEGVLYAVPWLGVAAWENVTLVDTGDANTIGVLVGDDREAAPLLLYVGQKNAVGDDSFLDRNGLAQGHFYVWVADNGDTTPEDWNGTGTSRTGTFVEIPHYDDPTDGVPPGYDALGFATQETQDALAEAAGAFKFSRPEDVATNPEQGTQVVLASTGRGGRFPSDNWGTTYIIDLSFGSDITANLSVLYDGDDAGNGQFSDPDHGLRSPDNLDWADDGLIYVQEDRSTSPSSLFGATSGEEASIWAIHPDTGALTRIGQVDRSAVPAGQTDGDPEDLGDWETSGVLDVTDLFQTRPGERLLLLDVQAHSLGGGVIDQANLVEGGQLGTLSTRLVPPGHTQRSTGTPQAASIPADFALTPGFPNPFRRTTQFAFSAPEAGHVRLAVYDALGREVGVLFDGVVEPGRHEVLLDALHLPSGTYVVRMTADGGFDASQRVTLMR